MNPGEGQGLEGLAMDEEQLLDAEPQHPRVFTVTQHDIDRCPDHQLAPAHYRQDGTCLHHNSHATDMFSMNWCNDQDVYLAVLRLARGVLRVRPNASKATVGQAVLDLLRPKAEANATADNLWGVMHRDVQDWGAVDPEAVGDEVLDLLEVER